MAMPLWAPSPKPDYTICLFQVKLYSAWNQGRNRNIFVRGQINFSRFFSRREMLFPGRKFPFWLTQNKFQSFRKVKSKKKKKTKTKQKKKKKKRFSPHFVTFPHSIFIFNLPFLDFPSFLIHFPFFPCLSFPDGSAKISQSEDSGGGALLEMSSSAKYLCNYI